MSDNTITPGRTFKSQRQAVLWLKDLGYKVTTSTFNNHHLAGHVPTNAQGQFDEVTLRSYANLKLEPVEKRAAADGLHKSLEKTSADARLKNIQADRQQLKLERERGNLMPRDQYEKMLAARAIFFRREIENYIQLYGAAIIHLVGGREEALPELLQYWSETTADWMHAWSHEREFVVDLELEPSQPEQSIQNDYDDLDFDAGLDPEDDDA